LRSSFHAWFQLSRFADHIRPRPYTWVRGSAKRRCPRGRSRLKQRSATARSLVAWRRRGCRRSTSRVGRQCHDSDFHAVLTARMPNIPGGMALLCQGAARCFCFARDSPRACHATLRARAAGRARELTARVAHLNHANNAAATGGIAQPGAISRRVAHDMGSTLRGQRAFAIVVTPCAAPQRSDMPVTAFGR
jgi:hypothetical protein